MESVKKRDNGEVIYHVLIWVLLIGPHSVFSSYLIEQHLDLLLYCVVVADGLLILAIYFIRYKLIENYFQKKKYATFTLWLIMAFVIYIAACVKMETDISKIIQRENKPYSYAFYYFISVSRYTVIAFLLFKVHQNIQNKRKLDEVRLEKLKTEVNYLRAQINPHFLFNTLNNLYGLALEKSDKTPELIVRLSQMMDYMLYEVEGTKVLLRRDVENLENYLEMERIRQGNHAVIRYTKEGAICNQLIEPLLLLPLVENAFKHGVNQLINGAYLEITLRVSDHGIFFAVKNNYKRAQNNHQAHQSMGLVNLRKRLELFYPDRHSLEVYDDHVNYHVVLSILEAFSDNDTTTDLNSHLRVSHLSYESNLHNS